VSVFFGFDLKLCIPALNSRCASASAFTLPKAYLRMSCLAGLMSTTCLLFLVLSIILLATAADTKPVTN
jgi:hypothetical protein